MVSPSESVTSASKRKHRPGLQRVAIACERCRSRKHKCDRKLPECSACLAASAECVVLDRTTHRHYPRGHVEEMEAQLQSLKARLEDVELENAALKQDLDSARRRNGPRELVYVQTTEGGTPGVAVDPSPKSPFECLSEEINLVPSDVTSGRRFVGESSGLFFGKIVQAVLLQADYKGEQGPASDALRLRVSDHTDSSASQTVVPAPRFEFPHLDLAHRLQNAYWTCRWPSLPFLHWPTFMSTHFGPVIASPTQASDVSCFITLMVLALGAIDVKRQDQSFGDKHLAYFQHATAHYLDGLLKEDSIETVQGLLLIAQFSINEHRSANAWLVVGQAVRTAIDLGLHRLQPGNFDLCKSEMRKRVFWASYALDRNISITLGRPCAIRDEDIDMPLPSNLTDANLLTGDTLHDGAFIPNHPQDMSTFVHIIQLRQIQSNIQSLFYAADAAFTQAGSARLHQATQRARLEEWISRSPRYTQSTMATFQTTEWFQIAYSHALLLLYRPSPARPITDAAALQTCADSAIGLISSYSTLYAKNKITYTWIALHGLFMASVTMLYTLHVSHEIRASTTRNVVKSNIASCLALFQVMAEHWPLALRCHDIIDRLGNATLILFDAPSQELPTTTATKSADTSLGQQHFGQIDTEFMDWFGTRDSRLRCSFDDLMHDSCQDLQVSEQHVVSNPQTCPASLPQDLSELFSLDFDTSLPMMMNVFGDDTREDTG